MKGSIETPNLIMMMSRKEKATVYMGTKEDSKKNQAEMLPRGSWETGGVRFRCFLFPVGGYSAPTASAPSGVDYLLLWSTQII